MTIEEFIKARHFMCKENYSCPNCKLLKKNNDYNMSCDELEKEYPEVVAKVVEAWWEKNKPRTNAEWIAESAKKLGYKVDVNWIIENQCPPQYSQHFFGRADICPYNGDCSTCKAWWNKEYK